MFPECFFLCEYFLNHKYDLFKTAVFSSAPDLQWYLIFVLHAALRITNKVLTKCNASKIFHFRTKTCTGWSVTAVCRPDASLMKLKYYTETLSSSIKKVARITFKSHIWSLFQSFWSSVTLRDQFQTLLHLCDLISVFSRYKNTEI